ncbi:hypothetical protein Tco_0312693 [Tanacetum coccineum]
MSTQQDIYAAGSENRPPMLNKENYVPWSSRLLRYAKSRPNGKLIYNSIMNGPYVRRMIPEPVAEIKQMEADDQAIQTILLGLPEDIYAAVDSCETAQEIWLRVQQMMKGSDIGIQEKKAKLFNEWERFTSTDGESIESYYHRFSKLMNDFKRNKHFPEKIASNLNCYGFLDSTINKEVDDQRVNGLAKTHDPLALMANSTILFNYPCFTKTYATNQYKSEDITDSHNCNEMARALWDCSIGYEYGSRQIDVDGWSTDCQNQVCSDEFRIRLFRLLVIQMGNWCSESLGIGNVVAARAEGMPVSQGEGKLLIIQTQLWIVKRKKQESKLQAERSTAGTQNDTLPSMIQTDQLRRGNRVDITTKTRRPQPRSNTKNDRVPSASKSSRIKNKEVEVEDHPKNLMLSKNKKHMSSECNNIKLAI